VVWSPASIWTSMADTADWTRPLGPRKTWFWAFDRTPSDPLDLFVARLPRRADFFVQSWDQPIAWYVVPHTQPETWTSAAFPCRDSMIAAARLERQETYTARFLSWRWRLATEQMIDSHQTIDPVIGLPRFVENDKRMLLACGEEDDVNWNEICDATWKTVPYLTLTPGLGIYAERTGHSLDVERPRWWARTILQFLYL
jgi:hypothetical protein